LSQGVLWGYGERPGIMAEAENGWAQLRARTNAFSDTAAMVPREFKPYGNESAAEALWNDRFEAMLERVVIRTGLDAVSGERSMRNGWQYGADSFMRWGSRAALYGFQPFYAYWEHGYGLKSSTDRLILTPLLHSAVQSVTATVVRYQSNTGLVTLARDRVVWLSPNAAYGFAIGPALLRPLVQPWTAYQEQVITEDIDTASRAGIAQIYDGGGGGKNADAWEAIGEAIDDGQRWIRIPGSKNDGVGVEISYPSGTPPDFESKAKRLRATIDDIFGTEVLGIAASGNGSRAAAETMAGITAKVGMASADSLLRSCFTPLAAWVAFHAGYDGRFRRVCVAVSDDQDPHKLVTTLVAAKGAELLNWGPNREAHLAELLRLPEEDAPAAVDVPAPGAEEPPERAPREVVDDGAGTAVDPAAITQEEGIAAPEQPSALSLFGALSFTPPDAVRSNARRGLELRKEHERGGTAVGVARARDLASGNVSRETIGRMRSFFARHSGNDRSDESSAANIAWLLWGGDSGRRWVESQEMDAKMSAMGVATLIAGPPGAGKSTRAGVIARDSDGPVTVIDADRYLYGADGVFDWSPANSKAAHDLVARDIGAAIERGDSAIVLVAPFTTAKVRAVATASLRAAGYTVNAIQMTPDADTMVTRNQERPDGRGVAEGVVRAIADRFEPIADSEFDTVEVDRGSWRMSHECGHECGHGATLSQRDPLILTIRGQEVRPESHFPWSSDKDQRTARLEALERTLADFLPDARNRLLETADDLDAFDRVKLELRASVEDIIGAHLDTARDDARSARDVEAAAQGRSPIKAPAGTDPAMWRGLEQATRERIDRAARQAASGIIEKVANEVATHVGLTGGPDGFAPNKKVESYVREVEPLDNGVSNGEIEVGGAPPGMVITAAVRLSTKRDTVCGPCDAEHGRTFLFPEDRQAFEDYRGVPDPLCTGGTAYCECTWGLVYGTPEDQV